MHLPSERDKNCKRLFIHTTALLTRSSQAAVFFSRGDRRAREGRGDVEHEKDVAMTHVVIYEAHHMAALEFVTQVYWEQLSDGRHLV